MKVRKISFSILALSLFFLPGFLQAQTPSDCPPALERIYMSPRCIDNPEAPPCKMALEKCPHLPSISSLPDELTSPGPTPPTSISNSEPIEITQNSSTESTPDTDKSTSAETEEQKNENKEETKDIESIKVSEVIDGDTIKVEINGNKERVRLIGVDAPELGNDEMPAECYGEKSKEKLTSLLKDKNIKLQPDGQTSDKDEYERLLRYIYLEDGTNINKTIIEEGAAVVHEHYPFGKMNEFKDAEKKATEEKIGLHANDVCPKEEEPVKTEEQIEKPPYEMIEEKPENKQPQEESKFSPTFFATLSLLLAIGILIIIIALYPKKK